MKKQKWKLAVLHPLEFDKTFYTEEMLKKRHHFLPEERRKRLTAKAELLDIWERFSKLDEFKGMENNLWFFHPVYFINHLERMGVLKIAPDGLERFTDKVRSLVGIPYKLGKNSSTGIDCSGVIIYALNEIGYTVPDITSAHMASGKVDWITVTAGDTIPQSTPGILNFYDWGNGIEHVNVGVGQRNGEPIGQVVDATEGDWMVARNGNPNQVIPAGTKQVNQTYDPYLNNRRPVKQGRINFDVLDKKYIIKE